MGRSKSDPGYNNEEMIVWNPSTIRKDTPFGVLCSIGFGLQRTRVISSCLLVHVRLAWPGARFIMWPGPGRVFDSHGSHSLIRRVLHGQMENIDEKELEKMRLPVQLAEHQGEVIYGLPGICDSDRVSFYLVPPIL